MTGYQDAAFGRANLNLSKLVDAIHPISFEASEGPAVSLQRVCLDPPSGRRETVRGNVRLIAEGGYGARFVRRRAHAPATSPASISA